MAFGTFDAAGAATRPMAEINMIPLIDVMLVLLVIFIVTAPLLTHAVKLDLPRAASAPSIEKPETVRLAIDAQRRLFWNGERIDRAGLRERLDAAGRAVPPPEVRLRADRTTPYEAVAQVLADSARAGVTRFGFESDPDER